MELNEEQCRQHPSIYVQVECRFPPTNYNSSSNDNNMASSEQLRNGRRTTQSKVVTVKVDTPSQDGSATATHVTTETRTLATSLASLKMSLAQLTDLPVQVLTISHDNRPLADDQLTLEKLGATVNGSIALSLTSRHPAMYPIRRVNPSHSGRLLPVPDVITVRLKDSQSI